jgi:hypothetical protein
VVLSANSNGFVELIPRIDETGRFQRDNNLEVRDSMIEKCQVMRQVEKKVMELQEDFELESRSFQNYIFYCSDYLKASESSSFFATFTF